ncbi:hypothetical protein NEOLEDRAFT_1136948 [Neolentinus lepideus HHB14362 ss-1]|uniref:F-box domain-containing protein n=1 Tax=Neolentinus lepideus HHB14362 ss-1 TaxID=1314782 RepID=A0A165QZ36_9AGAM|nr:hypothetical protein NEOLEDRAFT_1136948 [Neolentinus lepideus HHB14362 ss-1]
MDSLPNELLEAIFSEALLDGGRTACCLRLVSKSMRALIEPFRFYRVELTSTAVSGSRALPSQYQQFLSTYKAASPIAQGGGIRHLSSTVEELYQGVLHVGEFANELVALAAPTLRTLRLHCRSTTFGFVDQFKNWIASNTQFPQLTDCTMFGVSAVDHLIISPDRCCLFPLLRSLRISFTAFDRLGPVHKTAQSIIAASSQTYLTCVEVSQVDVTFTPPFWDLLRFELGLAPDDYLTRIGENDLLPLPPCVKEFTIVMRPSSVDAVDRRESEDIQAQLAELTKEAAEKRGVAFELLPPLHDANFIWFFGM